MNDETEEYENGGDGSGKSSISADLIRGHINTIILRSLYDRDKYGYEIINEINEKSHGQYTLKQPTLYSALKRLENQGYIQAYWKADEVSSGGRRKYFRLTDAGKEVTEKNQAEWEYSRTVIDNLISDRNFDFSQPAPTPVDFSLLKKSTTRIPNLNDNTDEQTTEVNETEEEQAATEENQAEAFAEPADTQAADEKDTPENTNPYTDTFTFTAVSESTIILEPEITQEEQPAEEPEKNVNEETAEKGEENITDDAAEPKEELQEPIQEEQTEKDSEQDLEEERKRITHENYMRLISGEAQADTSRDDVVPGSENINTENLIYNSLPETERNYKNMVEKLFYNTIKPTEPVGHEEQRYTNAQPNPQPPVPPQQPQTRINVTENYYNSANDKAANDGLKIYTASGNRYSESAHYTTYNKGATLFKCSLIIGVILLFEFVMCLLFKDDLKVSYAYPFVILALDIAVVLVFGILYWAGYGRQVRKPANQRYILTSAIITIIAILIILIIAICTVSWTDASDIATKFILPIIIALNIPIFTLSFYLLTK